MLKIKDNVDLKELEKFGYEVYEDWWNRGYYEKGDIKGKYIYYKPVDLYKSIEIEIDTRKIFESYDDMYREVEEKYINDLIKADLVEKVGEIE